MATNTNLHLFENEFFKKIREADAWKLISEDADFPWSESIIEKYSDKWDWSLLGKNSGIGWSAGLIEKFKRLIDWDAFSERGGLYRYQGVKMDDWGILKKFESYWNWHKLSESLENIPVEIIELHADKWDWKELIQNRNIKWSFELFDKFKHYIPLMDIENLKNSELWKNLIEIEKLKIAGKILSEV